ncbi:MAG: lysylphosphatidylglycerol synthase transmembrane domain-containing protein [Bacteroidota bacterium]
MKVKITKSVKTAIKIVLSLGALFFVFTKIEFQEVLAIYKNSEVIFLFIAIILFAASKFIAAIRLNHFFRAIDIFLDEVYNLKLYLLGMFYNLFLPGGIGGDGYKIYWLNKRHKIKTQKIFWAVFHDRLNGVLALFCLAVLLSLFINIRVSLPYKSWIWILIPFSIIIFYGIIRRFFPHFRTTYLKATSYSFFVQIIQAICAYVIFLAIGGSKDLTGYLFIFLVSSIVAMLPITIGGIGSREITFLYGSKLMGLDEHLSIAMSLMFYLITAFVSFWGIYFSIRGVGESIFRADDLPEGKP